MSVLKPVPTDPINLPEDLRNIFKSEVEPVLDAIVDAEKIIKEIEQSHLYLVIPAVNELRYAGRHILSTYSCLYENKNWEVFTEELRKAKSHSKRARYDAYQAGIYFYIDLVKKFRKTYQYIVFSDIIPDYVDDCKKFNDAMSFIGINHHNSDLDFDGMKLHYENLKSYYEKLYASTDDVNRAMQKRRTESMRFTIGTIIGILAIIVAIIIAS